jgi:plastocyanin
MVGRRRGDISRKPHTRSVGARMVSQQRTTTLRALPEGGTMSIKSPLVLVAAAATIAVPAASGGGATTITISHQTKGCHRWQLNDGQPKVGLSLAVRAGSSLRVVNNDVMPHRLIQQAGPKVALRHANMNRMSASMSVRFTRAGTYRFTTKAGEDYAWMKAMAKTIGEDNVLHLTVHVR